MGLEAVEVALCMPTQLRANQTSMSWMLDHRAISQTPRVGVRVTPSRSVSQPGHIPPHFIPVHRALSYNILSCYAVVGVAWHWTR